jgi:hypothetical protein
MAPRNINEYGSINVKQEDGELEPLVVSSEGKTTLNDSKRCTWNWRAIAWGLALAVISVVLYIRFPRAHQNAAQPDITKHAYSDSSSGSASPPSPISTNYPPLSMTRPHSYLQSTERASDATPSTIWGPKFNATALPTNGWYLNLVSHKAAHQPDEATRAYTVPYIIDTAAANKMAGIRVHWPVIQAGSTNIQMVDDVNNGLTLGTLDSNIPTHYQVDQEEDLSLLGVSLRWSSEKDDKNSMLTHIVR